MRASTRSIAPSVFRPGRPLAQTILRRWLKACGRGVCVFSEARLVNPEKIVIGDGSQVDDGVYVFAGEGVRLGCHVHLAFHSSISGGGTCVVGDFVGIGAGVRIITGTEVVDGTGLTNPTVPARYRAVKRGWVTVEPHAVIFTNSVVLPDVTIGEGAVVAAGSIVHRDLKPWAIYAGSPLAQVGVRPAERVRQLAKKLREERWGEALPQR